MPKDRSLDRHRPDRRAVLWRTSPELVARLDAVVGRGKRSETLDDLVAAWLNGKPAPPLPNG